MKNNKGFTLVELLAVVAILGILSGIAIGAYSRYINYSKRKGYDTLAKSASHAAEQYTMDNAGALEVSFATLVEEEYLENDLDPADGKHKCKGIVKINYQKNLSALDTQTYTVSMCCIGYNYTYNFPGTKVKDDTCQVE